MLNFTPKAGTPTRGSRSKKKITQTTTKDILAAHLLCSPKVWVYGR